MRKDFFSVSEELVKILGIDYGDISIGLAIFDIQIDFIYPVKTIFRKRKNALRKSLVEIEKVISENNIEKIVIGLPLNADGSESNRVKETKEFGEKLKNRISGDIVILFEDERWTTLEAKEIIAYKKLEKAEQKKYIDQIAASLILENYKNNNKGG